MAGRSGVSYEWQSPDERKERILQLQAELDRPRDVPEFADKEFGAPQFTKELTDIGHLVSEVAFIGVLWEEE